MVSVSFFLESSIKLLFCAIASLGKILNFRFLSCWLSAQSYAAIKSSSSETTMRSPESSSYCTLKFLSFEIFSDWILRIWLRIKFTRLSKFSGVSLTLLVPLSETILRTILFFWENLELSDSRSPYYPEFLG